MKAKTAQLTQYRYKLLKLQNKLEKLSKTDPALASPAEMLNKAWQHLYNLQRERELSQARAADSGRLWWVVEAPGFSVEERTPLRRVHRYRWQSQPLETVVSCNYRPGEELDRALKGWTECRIWVNEQFEPTTEEMVRLDPMAKELL